MKPYRTLAASVILGSTVIGGALVLRAEAQPESMDEPMRRIATVDTVGLLEVMLETEEDFLAERERVRTGIEDELEDVRSEIEGIQLEAQQLSPDDPQLQMLQQRFQRATQRLSQVQEQSAMRVEELTSRQARDGYGRIHSAIDSIAEERGLDHVMATRRGGEIPASRGTPTAVFQDILARPLVVSPESSDITELVRERLDLPDRSAVQVDPLGERGVDVGPGGGGL